ncbi:MAG: NAD-dependent epimerase/dehydratase family protein [Chloroflexota bacterium]
MRVFVTGATGFVMGAVARALRARGDAVTALVRDPSRAASLSALGCELVAGDVVDPTDAVEQLRKCDALVHGAAIYEIGVNAERRRTMEETNVTGTRRMLDAAKAAGTKRMVYVSTIAAFGNTHCEIVAEDHRPTSPPTSAYEDTKRRAHEIALDAAKSGAPIVIVQPGQVYGPNDHSAVGANFRALADGRLRYRAFEDLGLNLVHVDDLADGILRALDRGRAGECYILGGEIATLGDAYRAVARATGRGLPPIVIPSAIVRIAGRLIPSMREVVSSADGVTFWATDAKARAELGTTPRDLDTGMRDTFAVRAEGA